MASERDLSRYIETIDNALPQRKSCRARGLPVMLPQLKGPMALTLLRTFMAQGIAAGGSFMLLVVLGRLYGTAGVGVYALAQSLLMAVAIFSRYGMDNALMRFVGRDVQAPHVYAYLRYACIKALLFSIVGGVALFFSRNLWACLFDAPLLAPVLVGIAVAAPAFALIFIFAGFMKAVRKPATACLLHNGVVAFVSALIVWLLQNAVLPDAGLVNIGIAFAVAAWVLAGVGMCLSWRWHRVSYIAISAPICRSEVCEFNRSSSAFFATSVAQILISVAGIWVAGYFLTASDVGLFKVALQVSGLIGIVIFVINVVYPPQFAALYHKGQVKALGKLARQGALFGLCLAAPPIIVCLVAPGWVLHFVGQGFSTATVPLYTLIFAQLISIAFGSVGYVLNMSGNELLQRNIAWSSNAAGLLAMLGMTPFLGISGAATGVAIAMFLRKFAGAFFAWRKLGIWVPVIPNVPRLVGYEYVKSAEE